MDAQPTHWEHGDCVRISASQGGGAYGWILDFHEDKTVTLLLKDGIQRRGPIIGGAFTSKWRPQAYAFHEGMRTAIRTLRALKRLS